MVLRLTGAIAVNKLHNNNKNSLSNDNKKETKKMISFIKSENKNIQDTKIGLARAVITAFTINTLIHWLDTIVTHQQGSGKKLHDTVSQIYKKEGISGAYKGFIPGIFRSIPQRSMQCMGLEVATDILNKKEIAPNSITGKSFTGALAGVFETIGLQPLEVVKILKQNELPNHLTKQLLIHSPHEFFKKMYPGFMAQLARNVPANTAWWGGSKALQICFPKDMQELPWVKIGTTFVAAVSMQWWTVPAQIISNEKAKAPLKTYQEITKDLTKNGFKRLFVGTPAKAVLIGTTAVLVVVGGEKVEGWIRDHL